LDSLGHRQVARIEEGIFGAGSDVMTVDVTDSPQTALPSMAMTGRRRLAWILVFIVDAGFVAWGAMAAGLPDYLLGPDGKPILPAGYEGFTGGSWSDLVTSSPMTAAYVAVLFRMYGVFNVVFGLMGIAITTTAFRRGEPWAWWALLAGNTIALVSAMTYDRTVNAIGPFELSEYLGLALIWVALACTAPFMGAARSVRTG
jgi:hypothetical protein